jgi:DNA-binding NarL/FixJ family response regulator
VARKAFAATLAANGFDTAVAAPSAERMMESAEPLDAVLFVCQKFNSREASAVRALAEWMPQAGIVVVASEQPPSLRECLDAGANGFVLDSPDAPLALTVRAVCSGQLCVPRDLWERLSRPALSGREKQILGMVVMGFSNAEIARKLYVTESTVKSHLSSAFARLGVRSRNEAADLILDPRNGLGAGILEISGDARRRRERATS